jgi:hypothetical protein
MECIMNTAAPVRWVGWAGSLDFQRKTSLGSTFLPWNGTSTIIRRSANSVLFALDLSYATLWFTYRSNSELCIHLRPVLMESCEFGSSLLPPVLNTSCIFSSSHITNGHRFRKGRTPQQRHYVLYLYTQGFKTKVLLPQA